MDKTFKIICWIVLLSFSGCVTTHIQYVEPEKLQKQKAQKVYWITKLYLTDGKVIDLKDKHPVLKLKHKDKGNAIVYDDADGRTRYIGLQDVHKIKIEVMEGNILGTVLIITGAFAAVILLLLILYPKPDRINITG